MLHYKASDIVKRAKDIADIRGSDFVSDEEMLSLLNESWTDIYSKLINLNDKSFLSKIEISGEETELPEDFYQLAFIVDKLNQPIERHTVGSLGSYYELVNNTIQLHNVSEAYLYYYSTPATITFPKPTISNAPVSGDESTLYPAKPEFYIKEWGQLYTSNGVVLYKSDNFNKYYGHRRYIFSKEATEEYGYNVIVDYDGNQYVYKAFKPEAEEGSNYKWLDFYVDGEKVQIQTTEHSSFSTTIPFSSQIFYHLGPHKWLVQRLGFTPTYILLEYSVNVDCLCIDSDLVDSYKIGTRTLLPDNTYTFETIIDGHMYSEDLNGCYLDGDLIYKKDISPSVREGVLFSVNHDTGYGAFFNNVLNIYSVLPDTELNFPSNIYFNILAYQVAYAIACKQGKDCTFIEKQLASQWDIFYNTLNRDGFGQSKVINTYRGD